MGSLDRIDELSYYRTRIDCSLFLLYADLSIPSFWSLGITGISGLLIVRMVSVLRNFVSLVPIARACFLVSVLRTAMSLQIDKTHWPWLCALRRGDPNRQ
ncbi:hypothetical protein H4582DRAFT_1902710 [Lactarius indigo]|nr:hypothetical protein H4582DRAFT_1902710 [Lactarius indigo]